MTPTVEWHEVLPTSAPLRRHSVNRGWILMVSPPSGTCPFISRCGVRGRLLKIKDYPDRSALEIEQTGRGFKSVSSLGSLHELSGFKAWRA